MLLHLVLFGYLARVAPVLRTPIYAPQPDVQLEVAPIPDAFAPVAPRRTLAVSQQTPRSALAARRAAPRRDAPPRTVALPSPGPPAAPKASTTPPGHAAEAPPAAGARSGAGPAASGGGARGGGDARGDDGRDGVRAFLRATVGCSHQDYLHLTIKERTACAQRLGHDAAAMQDASADPLSARDRAYFNAVRDADEAARLRRAPGYGCALLGKDDCALGGSTAGGAQGLAPHP